MTEKRVKCHSFLRTLRFWREMLRFSSRKLPAWRGLGFCFSLCFIFCFLFFVFSPNASFAGHRGPRKRPTAPVGAPCKNRLASAQSGRKGGRGTAERRWTVGSPFSQSLWAKKVCAVFYDTPRALGSLGLTFRLRHSLSIFSARRARSPFRRRSDSALRGQAKCARWQGRSRSAYGQIPCGRRSV